MTTINTHSLSIGEPELKQPIPDYMLNEILGGTRIPNQGMSKGLARQVKELRKDKFRRIVKGRNWNCPSRGGRRTDQPQCDKQVWGKKLRGRLSEGEHGE